MIKNCRGTARLATALIISLLAVNESAYAQTDKFSSSIRQFKKDRLIIELFMGEQNRD
jgi:hypothetical protein